MTHEANSNYNPVNDFVGASYQLDRVINTFVVNNTYVLNSSTVLTLRGGYNHFDDNYNLNDRSGNPLTSTRAARLAFVADESDVRHAAVPVDDHHRLQGTGLDDPAGERLLPVRRQRHAEQASRHAQLQGRRRLPHHRREVAQLRRVDRHLHFTGTFSGNALADLLLGYPQSGNIPLEHQLDGYVHYYSGYAQDDWRVSDRLTLNYGLRLEHETGLTERNNQITVNFDQNAVNPLNNVVKFIDPITGQPRTLLGGLIFAGVNGAPTVQGNQPAVKPAPRVGAVYSFNDKTVLRGGWGLYCAPWNYPAAGTTGWGQIGYSATTNIQQPTGVPTITMSNPFPDGLVPTSGKTSGTSDRRRRRRLLHRSEQGRAAGAAVLGRPPARVAEGMTLTVGYTGLTGSNLSWGGTTDTSININQIDPKYQTLTQAQMSALVPNPFFGVAAAGPFASRQTIETGQLLRPFPQFGNVNMNQSTGAHSQYHAAIFQLRKRATGIWGGDFSYTYSRLNDNQFGRATTIRARPDSRTTTRSFRARRTTTRMPNTAAAFSIRRTRSSSRRLVNLPFGQGKKFLQTAVWRTCSSAAGRSHRSSRSRAGSRSASARTRQARSSCSAARRGRTSSPVSRSSRQETSPIGSRANPSDNLFFNKAAFSTSAANTFGNAPRILPGVLSPWRNNVDLSIAKNVRTGASTTVALRLEVLNVLNIVQWAGLSATSSAFNNSTFGQITTQANNMRMMQFTIRVGF